jgi:large subunit ribosomal protein L9
MFGSISNKQIEDSLKKLGYNIDKKNISCDHAIDSLGVHKVKITLYKNVEAVITVTVE